MNTRRGFQSYAERQAALFSLARALNIDADTLKIALNNAYDLMSATRGCGILALHISLNQMNYRIDYRTVKEAVACCQAFTASMQVRSNQLATAQAASNRYHGQQNTQSATVQVAPAQYHRSTSTQSATVQAAPTQHYGPTGAPATWERSGSQNIPQPSYNRYVNPPVQAPPASSYTSNLQLTQAFYTPNASSPLAFDTPIVHPNRNFASSPPMEENDGFSMQAMQGSYPGQFMQEGFPGQAFFGMPQ